MPMEPKTQYGRGTPNQGLTSSWGHDILRMSFGDRKEAKMPKFRVGDKVRIRAADTPYDGYQAEVVEYVPESAWPYRVQVIIREDFAYTAEELDKEEG